MKKREEGREAVIKRVKEAVMEEGEAVVIEREEGAAAVKREEAAAAVKDVRSITVI